MRKLLLKEIILSTNIQIVLFTTFALFILIPSWPSALAFVYPLSGLMTLFPRGLANRDIEYTSLLPVKKTDVVKGKCLYFIAIEMVVILLAVIGGSIRFFAYPEPSKANEVAYYFATRPSISLLGIAFIAFGLMNWILLSTYYKNPYKRLAVPNLVSLLSCIIVLAVGSVLIAFVPVLREYDMMGWVGQISMLVGGLVLFVLFSFIGYKSGAKAFTKVDL